MGRDGVDVGRRHVRGHGLDLGPRSAEPGPEILQGIPAFSLAHVNHRPAFQVQDDRQVDVPLGRGNLVDGDLPQVFQFRPVEPPLQVGLLDLLDHVPTDAQVLGHVLDGHVPGEFQGVPLKGFGIGDARIGKANLHLSDHAAVIDTPPGGPPAPGTPACRQSTPCGIGDSSALAQSRRPTHRPDTDTIPVVARS